MIVAYDYPSGFLPFSGTLPEVPVSQGISFVLCSDYPGGFLPFNSEFPSAPETFPGRALIVGHLLYADNTPVYPATLYIRRVSFSSIVTRKDVMLKQTDSNGYFYLNLLPGYYVMKCENGLIHFKIGDQPVYDFSKTLYSK